MPIKFSFLNCFLKDLQLSRLLIGSGIEFQSISAEYRQDLSPQVVVLTLGSTGAKSPALPSVFFCFCSFLVSPLPKSNMAPRQTFHRNPRGTPATQAIAVQTTPLKQPNTQYIFQLRKGIISFQYSMSSPGEGIYCVNVLFIFIRLLWTKV